jgi:hypothetical protein
MEKIKELIAICIYIFGRKPLMYFNIDRLRPYVTTFIDGEILMYGYGEMNTNGWFEYNLPSKYIEKTGEDS